MSSNLKIIVKIGCKMSSFPEKHDMLDVLAFNCSELANKLWTASSVEEKNGIVENYLKTADKEGREIEDFKEDLDWFNVTEPLSFNDSLKGKVVVLDFFTYCCINCMHILPDLKKLEHLYSVEDGLVLVGVHSAKFDNEKDSANILSAVQRYDITHPVVNDNISSMWSNLNIQCWPTLLILGPRANPLFVVMGEGHFDDLNLFVSSTLKFYKTNNAISSHQLPLNPATDLVMSSNLHFPGKISCSVRGHGSGSEMYAISDSGNHRILVINPDGDVLHKIGGKKGGFVDGDFKKARFNAPQGLAFLNDDVIFVADTENHAVRKIDLKKQTVITMVGNGEQGTDRVGGKIGREQLISSPWDIAIYRTRDMDMSFHVDESKIKEKDVVLIAMAGIHQIWALFLEPTIWWKFKKYETGTCHAIAGNGREENRNNSYPTNAAFAQPSGLAISRETKELYLADSESSSVRKLSLTDGKVSAVAGADRNPLDLFSFGDVDGKQFSAKFQHCLGLAYNPNENVIYLADTYNHKVKKIQATTYLATSFTVYDSSNNSHQFNEPAGLCLSPSGEILYVADTNNHKIEMIDLKESRIKTLNIRFNASGHQNESGNVYIYDNLLRVSSKGAKIRLNLNISTMQGVKMTQGAPQKYSVTLPVNEMWLTNQLNGSVNGSSPLQIDILAPNEKSNKSREDSLMITFKLNLCANEVCFAKLFSVQFNAVYESAGSDSLFENININVEKDSIKIFKA